PGAVGAQAGNDAVAGFQPPGALGEHAQVAEACVHRPRLCLVGATAMSAATAMAAVLGINAGGDVDPVTAPSGGGAAARGRALDVGCHRHGHRAVRVRVAQAVVVHDVVGAVVEHVGFDRVQRAG